MKGNVMKFKRWIQEEVEVASIRFWVAADDLDENEFPREFQGWKGDMLHMEIDLKLGLVKDWPIGETGELHLKVVDSGTYELMGPDGKVVARRENEYVPNDIIPGSYGDYIEMEIEQDGVVRDWPHNPDLDVFFPVPDRD